jgi:hypothetical protein
LGTIRVVSRLTRHWIPGVLLTVIVSLGLEVMPAVGSPVRPGAWYRATGHQPHDPAGAFSLSFRVAPGGHRLTLLQVSSILEVACVPGPRSLGLASDLGSARIQRNGAFRTTLTAIGAGDAAGTTMTVTGRFLSKGRARGTVRYRGPGPYQGCNANGTWTAEAWSLPPVQHFQGKTAQGTRVTFDRTIAGHPRLLRFDFGTLRATAGVPGCAPVSPTTSIASGPPWTFFTLPVKQRSFSGTYLGVDEAYVVDVAGRFDTHDRASGTMSYDDRVDCSTGVVHWTAHRTG